MVTDLIANIREELTKIKSFKKNRVGKMNAESLKSYPGFEKMSIELRQQFLDTMRELCRIALLHLSNGKKNDKFLNNKIFYILKNEKVKEKFKLNIKNNKRVRFFKKQNNGVKDMGLYYVKGFYNNYVVFIKNKF